MRDVSAKSAKDSVRPERIDLSEAAARLGIAGKARHYARALGRWAMAGFPTRSDEEVERIHQVHCKPCKYYRNGHCSVCGCRARRKGMALVNKIKMGTETCPKGEW